MATEKQIAANRANAQKSTGPRTAAGRLTSSRNAYRHGLSLPLHLDIATSAKAEAIASALTQDEADKEKLAAAAEVAQAQLELLRIRCRPRGVDGGGRPRRLPISTTSSAWPPLIATNASPLPSGDGHPISFRVQSRKD